MSRSMAFGYLNPRVPHLADRVAEKELADLRSDVESGFAAVEEAVGKPTIYSVRSNKTEKTPIPSLTGIGDTEETTLLIGGERLEGRKGRDKYTVTGGAVGADFEVYALALGDTGLHIDVVSNALLADDVEYNSTTKTITFKLTAAHPTPANMVTLLASHPAIDALIAVVPRDGGAGNITLPLSFDLVGGGASYHQVAGANVNGEFFVYARQTGRQDIYFQIVDDVVDASRYVEVVDRQIIVHQETGVTSALKVKNLIEASTAANALVGVWMVGTGASVIQVSDEDAAPVELTPGAEDPTTETVVYYLGANALTHLGTNYTAGTMPSEQQLVLIAPTGLTIGDWYTLNTTIDGQKVLGPALPVVDCA